MKTKYVLSLLFSVLSCVFFSTNAYSDGNKLLDFCLTAERYMNSDDIVPKITESVKVGYCYGIVEGVRQATELYQELEGVPKAVKFPEGGIDNDQSVSITVKYLKAHPEKLHLSEFELISSALQDAFPDKSKGNKKTK